MEKKTCNRCNIEKSIEEFSESTGKNGLKYRRNTCKECQNAQRKKNTNKSELIKYTKEPVLHTKSDNDLTTYIMTFTDAEITELKQIVKERMQLKIETTPSKRIVKTFNIKESLYLLLTKTAREETMSISDTLNKILQDFFYND